MTWTKWSMLLYALAMIGMGIHGTVVAHEWMSLIGGGGMGLIVLVGFFMALKMPIPRAGYIVAIVVALGGIGMFLPKYLGPKGVFYPHLVIVLLSVALIACLGGGHMAAMAAKKKEG
ncbi:MAG TPA: hypothetical protein VNI20_04915 [Fimbriimonadaceae bacterium]|nr:hypothetical protein [Fimbriimonadaceae bacterium]